MDAQLGRISSAIGRVYETSNNDADIDRMRNRWWTATNAYGRLSGDDKKIQSFMDYRPESRIFTSKAEMDRINEHFGLSNRSVESLRALRDNVVRAYANNRGDGMMQWMQSVTAVIDYYIRRKGAEA